MIKVMQNMLHEIDWFANLAISSALIAYIKTYSNYGGKAVSSPASPYNLNSAFEKIENSR